VHISELAQHHVENPREVVSQGDTVNVRILEVDAERRRLSLSLKRVEDGAPLRGPDEPAPQLDLSEDVFGSDTAAAAEDAISPGEDDAEYDAVALAEPAIDEADDTAIGIVEEEPATPAADDGEPMAVFEPETVEEPPADEPQAAVTLEEPPAVEAAEESTEPQAAESAEEPSAEESAEPQAAATADDEQ
jgi:small subunit ribosomal protein S1